MWSMGPLANVIQAAADAGERGQCHPGGRDVNDPVVRCSESGEKKETAMRT